MTLRSIYKLPLALLYADDLLLVINKPAGLLWAGGGPGDLSVPLALQARRDLPLDGPVLELDRFDADVSGVAVYARTPAARRALDAQRESGRIERVFSALVRGFVPRDGRVELPLRFDKRERRLCASPRRGTPAATHFRIALRVAGNTLLECCATPGLADQVRAHLAAIDHPLSVDPLYGDAHELRLSSFKGAYQPSRRRDERPLLARLSLHALRVALDHPGDGRRMTFEAPYPKDLRATINQLARLV